MPLLAFLCAAAVPVALWHDAIGAIAADFRFDLGYLTGWAGFGLIAAGLVVLLPVVWSARLSPASRLYPRFRNVYMGWGVSLYVLGLGLASQVAAAVG
jgi:hypothetical protein